MLMFLLIFLSTYGILHIYAFYKIIAAFPEMIMPARLVLAAVMIVLLTAPVLIHAAERTGLILFAKIYAWIGYLWMAAIFWFFFIGLSLDLWNLIVRLSSSFSPRIATLSLQPQMLLFVSAIVVALFTIWGFVEAYNIRLRKVDIESPLIAAGSEPIKIIQISDVHLGLIDLPGRFNKILNMIETNKPDLLISSGDLFDASYSYLHDERRSLANIKPVFGKFAVMGNHEFYAGAQLSAEFLTKAGFRVLRGETLTVADGRIYLMGVDDPAGHGQHTPVFEEEEPLLPSADLKVYAILIKHQPVVHKRSVDRFDLQLSGHSHSGQIFPFGLLVRLKYPLSAGFLKVGENSHVYHSRGTGTWGPPLRLFAPPEITLIRLMPKMSS